MDPYSIRLIGQSLGADDDDEWQSMKERVMFDILMAKYQYCPDYALTLTLLATPESVFKYRSTDPFWGALGGKNKLGKLHTHIKHLQSALATHNVNYINGYKLRHNGLHSRGYEDWT